MKFTAAQVQVKEESTAISIQMDEQEPHPIDPVDAVSDPDFVDPPGLTLQERTTPFEQALKAWRDINLTELQKRLDKQGLEIVENQKVSLLGRKELASSTKEFRKLSDEDKLVGIKGLLKSYQTEIDNLTKRGKVAENAFLNAYRVLAEAPDPYPLLDATLDSLLASDEVAALSTENAQLKSQLAKLADYDELQHKLQVTEQKVVDVAAQKVAAKEAELQALLDEKERNWSLREQGLNRQVEEAREQIRELRATHAVTEARLEHHEQKLDDGVAGRFADAELMAADLERVNLRALQTERRNLELRQELEKLKSSISGGDGTVALEDATEWKIKVEDLRSENAALGRKIDSMREEAKAAIEKESKALRTAERDLARRNGEIASLKQKLLHVADYEDIKRELDILKYVEFEVEAEDESESSPVQIGKSDSLEQLLLSRNKRLTAELTNIRIAHDDLLRRTTELETNLKTTTAALDESKRLNAKLEDDLTSLHESGMISTGPKSVTSYAQSRRSGRGTDTASLIGGSLRASLTGLVPVDDAMSQPGSGNSTPGGRSLEQHVADLTILPIITQQRDRFRARNAELEQELRTEYSRITDLRSQIETLQKDNVALYEKTRYLSTYRSGTSAAAVNASDSSSSSYRRDYEEQISPFQQFRGREQERALSRMGPLERIIYGLTRVVLANKASRNLFFGYVTCLHLFLMGIIWYLAIGEVGRHENIATPVSAIDQVAAVFAGGAGADPVAADGAVGAGVTDEWILAKPNDVVATATALARNVRDAAVPVVTQTAKAAVNFAGQFGQAAVPVAAPAAPMAAAPVVDAFAAAAPVVAETAPTLADVAAPVLEPVAEFVGQNL
ncbi:CASP C terminal-domain-containing protein [Lipomyces arxii]|uniref:CASP C terminal-domain-containing protein n=1 Tax=Lipomyces arxii TaxID=56418 RepID=UPI0034CDB835